jgi:molybdopterin-guanine dinucleotide biosynthesis protein B
MNRLHIVGRKNSGKTTLIVDLVRYFTGQGLKVGTIKHTHHRHQLDTPGKDSFLHRQAGAAAVGILSPETSAVFWTPETADDAQARYRAMEFAFEGCELVLVEGHSQIPGPKIEVWRSATDQPPIAQSDASVVALVSDESPTVAVPIWPRSDLPALAQRILTAAKHRPEQT